MDVQKGNLDNRQSEILQNEITIKHDIFFLLVPYRPYNLELRAFGRMHLFAYLQQKQSVQCIGSQKEIGATQGASSLGLPLIHTISASRSWHNILHGSYQLKDLLSLYSEDPHKLVLVLQMHDVARGGQSYLGD